MGILLDTTFLVDLLRKEPTTVRAAAALDAESAPAQLAAPVLFEILTGILWKKSRTEAAAFHAFASRFPVLPFDEHAARTAAEVRAELLRTGRVKPPVDVMIAGIALAEGHTLLTRDRDFQQIAAVVGLDVRAY